MTTNQTNAQPVASGDGEGETGRDPFEVLREVLGPHFDAMTPDQLDDLYGKGEYFLDAESLPQKPRVILITCCDPIGISFAMAQLSEAFHHKLPELLVIKQEVERASEKIKRPSLDELVMELNKSAIELSKVQVEPPPHKPKWKGKRGFNSARNRIIT